MTEKATCSLLGKGASSALRPRTVWLASSLMGGGRPHTKKNVGGTLVRSAGAFFLCTSRSAPLSLFLFLSVCLVISLVAIYLVHWVCFCTARQFLLSIQLGAAATATSIAHVAFACHRTVSVAVLRVSQRRLSSSRNRGRKSRRRKRRGSPREG